MSHFRVAVLKTYGATGRGSTWSNPYELNVAGDIASQTTLNAALAIVNFEKAFHQKNVQFISATITALDGAAAGTPQGTRTIGLSGTGSVQGPPENQESGEFIRDIVMYVDMTVSAGNGGRKGYRGCLSEHNVFWSKGVGTISDTQKEYFNIARDALFAALGAGKLSVEQTSKKVVTGYSDVTGMSVRGVSVWKASRRRRQKKTTDQPAQLTKFIENNAVDLAESAASLLLTKGRVGKVGLATDASKNITKVESMVGILQSMKDTLLDALQPG